MDSLGVESVSSEPIEVIIPSGTNTNRVTLQAVNNPFDSSTSTFNVYRSKVAPTGDGTPANNPQQASSGNTPPTNCSSLTLTDTGSSISGGGGGSGSGNPPPSQLYIKTRVYYQLPSESIWRLGAETNDASQTSLQFHLPHNIQGQQINVQLRNVFRNGYETPAGLAPVASYTIAAAYPSALGIGGAPGANDGLIIGGQHIFTRTGGMDRSTPVNVNGNIPASALNNGFLTLKLGSTGGSSVVMQWGGSQAGLMDGSFINMGTGSYSPPSAPTLSQVAAGTNAAVTWFVRLAQVRDNMIMAVGPEASFAVSANHLLSVASPSSVAGMDGWIPLISGSTNTEFVPTDRKNGIGLNVIAFGTNYTEPTGGFTFTGQGVNNWAVPLSSGSATSVTPTNCLLAASTTYFFYPSYDLVNQMLSFPAATGSTPGLGTAKNAFLAIAQCGDQRIALSTGAVSFTTPAANGNSSTTGGGGGGGGRALQ